MIVVGDRLEDDLRAALAALDAISDRRCARTADRLRIWLDGTDSLTFERACGVSSSWRGARLRRRRDDLYIELRVQHFAELDARPAAAAMVAMIEKYRFDEWVRDRKRRTRPGGRTGFAFDLLGLEARGEPLLGEESLRKLPGFDVGKNSPAESPTPPPASGSLGFEKG